VSRVLGLVRDVACAAVFGTTAVWSAFATAFIVPNLFRRLLGEGALSAAFVPEYTQAATRDAQRGAPLGEGEADRLASLTVALVGALLLAAVALAMLGLSVLTPEADAASRPWNSASVVHLTIVMLPFAPLVCITALLGGMLQAHGRFAPHAGAPIVLNLCMIAFATAGAWLYNNTLREAATVLGVGVVLAGVIQLVWCLLELRGLAGWTLRVRDALPAARRMVARMGPVLIGLGAAQLGMVIDALIAGWPVIAAEGGMEAAVFGAAYPLDVQAAAVLYYGQRLYQLPLGVFAIAVATAALPALAGAAKDPAAFAAVLRRGLRLSLFVGLPAAVGLALVREPLVVAAFGGAEQSAWPSISRFSVGDAERVAAVLLAYTPAIAAASANHVLARAFYAAGDTKTPMWIGLGAVTANVALNLWLIWSFAEVGLAIATSVTALGQTIALAIAARLRIPQLGRRLLDGRTAASLFAGAALSVAMGAAVWSALFVTRGMVEPTRSGAALTLLMGVGVGLAVYVAGSAVLRRPELGELLRGRGGGGEAGGP
jgi:putative peptidoglycan lipid II flippase